MKTLAFAVAGLAVAGLAVAAAPVAAADLPVGPVYKAPVIAPVASSWTGFYVGAGVGVRESHTQATSTTFQFGPTIGNVSPVIATDWLDSVAPRLSAYAGYNWQVAPRWVIGVEGDVGFANRTTTLNGFVVPAFETDSTADSFSVKTTWDASARARAGFLVTPTTLVYATGGVAWQHYEATSTCASTVGITMPLVGFGTCGSFASPAVLTTSVTRVGWTAGGGLEAALWGHWIARGEYRYADFGSAAFSFARTGTPAIFNPVILNGNIALSTHTVTFGLAYKFGDPIAAGPDGPGYAAFPTKAVAPATISWNGVYVGLGVGGRASEADATTTAVIAAGVPFSLSGVATSQQMNGIAFRASPYVGVNWQPAPRWVFGVEGDVGLARQTTTLSGFNASPASGGVFASGALQLETTWDASARARVGFLLTPTLLVYATGGVAWQHFEVTSTNGSVVGITPPVIVNSADKVGPTVGGGLEAALSANWFARAEYRYADFGTSSFTLTRTSPSIFFPSGTDTFDVRLRTHTAMFGIAYKPDWWIK